MELQLVVVTEADEDAGEVAPWTLGLREELETLDDTVVEPVYFAKVEPIGAKGLPAIPGGLLAKIPLATLKKLITVARDWATRTGRTVEASIDGDTIKITGASREQQDRVIEAWLVRHAAGS